MNDLYRGHEIVMLNGSPRSAVIIEHDTGIPLPTKVTALPEESEGACLRRARQLVDIYLVGREEADCGDLRV